MKSIPMTHTRDSQGWRFHTNRTTASLDSERQRRGKTKEGCWTPKILGAGNRLIKEHRYKQGLSLVQFSCSVVSDSLRPHGLQNARLHCPSPTPRACSNSCPLSQWCHPTSCLLSSPSPLAFNMSQHQGLFQYVSYLHQLSSVKSLSRVQLFLTPWIAAHCTSLFTTNSQSLLKLTFIESVMSSNRLILCHPILLTSIFCSIRVFSNESVLCIRLPKYWSFSFSISPSNEYSGLITFRWTSWISLHFKGLSRVFSNTRVQKHQFFGTQLSLETNSHIRTLLEKPCIWLYEPFLAK